MTSTAEIFKTNLNLRYVSSLIKHNILQRFLGFHGVDIANEY